MVSGNESVNIPQSKGGTDHNIPGWNDYVKSSHEAARQAFRLWRNASKPKQGFIFTNMLHTRSRFKYALRWCRNQEATIKADALADDLLSKNVCQFWTNVNKQSVNKMPLANTVGGATGHTDICKMWFNHFGTLFSCVSSESNKSFVENNICNIDPVEIFTVSEVLPIIRKLDKGKSCGLDGIFAEHVFMPLTVFLYYWFYFFNICIIHGYLPPDMIATVLTPILKDKAGDVTVKVTTDLLLSQCYF